MSLKRETRQLPVLEKKEELAIHILQCPQHRKMPAGTEGRRKAVIIFNRQFSAALETDVSFPLIFMILLTVTV
jgi:hypothetical protein